MADEARAADDSKALLLFLGGDNGLDDGACWVRARSSGLSALLFATAELEAALKSEALLLLSCGDGEYDAVESCLDIVALRLDTRRAPFGISRSSKISAIGRQYASSIRTIPRL